MARKAFPHLIKSLHDRKTCMEFLEEHRWHGTPICPHCHEQSKEHYKLKNEWLYKCKKCRKTFTVIKGTIFEGSHVALEYWFYAIYLFLAHKKGISSMQLSKDVGITQKTAWRMLHKVRENLNETKKIFANPFEGIVQIDETYIGGKNKGRFKNNRGRSNKQKTPVVGVLTKDRVYAVVVPDTTAKTLKAIVYGLIKLGSTVVTDEWPAYRGISRDYVHKVVEHGKRKYVVDGFHTNGIENFWSHLKRGIKGTYHVVSRKYLQAYCNEFAYRYNTRTIPDVQKFIDFISA